MSWERATDIATTPRPSWPDHEPRRDRPPNDALSRFGRVGLCTLPTPLEPMTRSAITFAATVGQARGLHRSRLRRQQAAQARLRAARGAARGRRHAGLGRRGAIQQPAPGRGRGAKLGLDCHLRRLSRQAGTASPSMAAPACAAQPPVRRHPARRAVERRSQRRHPRSRGGAAGRGPQDLCRALRRLQPLGAVACASTVAEIAEQCAALGSFPAPSPIARAAPARRPAWSSAPASACPRRASSASTSTPSPSVRPTGYSPGGADLLDQPFDEADVEVVAAMPGQPACRTTPPSRRSGSPRG